MYEINEITRSNCCGLFLILCFGMKLSFKLLNFLANPNPNSNP